ncbi:MAG: hypothetical protein WCI48_05045 [Bacteroidota bacterium]
MKDYKSVYIEIINKMIKTSNELIYITIKPLNETSLNQLRFIVKKSIRDIGKSLHIPYPRFLSVVEISSDITKGREYIKDMGLHSHIFLDVSFMDILINRSQEVEKILNNTFEKCNVGVDIKIVEDLYDIHRLKGYHLKQSEYLTPGFIDTNIPEYNKKLDRIIKYLKNLSYSHTIRKKIETIENRKDPLDNPKTHYLNQDG